MLRYCISKASGVHKKKSISPKMGGGACTGCGPPLPKFVPAIETNHACLMVNRMGRQ